MTATTTKNLPQLQWFSLAIPEVQERLESNLETGLTLAQAEGRHTRFGPNQLVGKPKKSAWMRFLLQFHQPLLYILLAW
nr:cation-transporting P-type ATPase [Chroococcidiopsis sp. CCALA 051]